MAQRWDCTNAEYHSSVGRIGSTMLKTALRSPREYRRRYIDADRLTDKQTPALLLGSVVHALVLEPEKFDSLYAVEPKCDKRTTAGKETAAKFALSAIGKTVVDADTMEKAKPIAAAALAHPWLAENLPKAEKEVAITWEEGGLAMKAKADIWLPGQGEYDIIVDLKTSDDPMPEEWAWLDDKMALWRVSRYSPIVKYGYHIAAAHYVHGFGEFTGRPIDYGLIVVGKSDPYEIVSYRLAGCMNAGERDRQQAIANILACSESGDWCRTEEKSVVDLYLD